MTYALGTETFSKYYEQGTFDLPIFEIVMRTDTNLTFTEINDKVIPILTRIIDIVRVKRFFFGKYNPEVLFRKY
jgi:hypothetical protein